MGVYRGGDGLNMGNVIEVVFRKGVGKVDGRAERVGRWHSVGDGYG